MVPSPQKQQIKVVLTCFYGLCAWMFGNSQEFMMTNTFPPGGVELTSATSAFSKMNGDGLCGACEVLMLRPIEGLLLLQLGFMMKCHPSDHPLSPTDRSLSISCCLSVCYSVCVPPCFCCLVLFLSPLFPPFHVCPYCSVSVPLLVSAWLSLTPSPSSL